MSDENVPPVIVNAGQMTPTPTPTPTPKPTSTSTSTSTITTGIANAVQITVNLKLPFIKTGFHVISYADQVINTPPNQDGIGVVFNGKSLTVNIQNVDNAGNVTASNDYTFTSVDTNFDRPYLESL